MATTATISSIACEYKLYPNIQIVANISTIPSSTIVFTTTFATWEKAFLNWHLIQVAPHYLLQIL